MTKARIKVPVEDVVGDLGDLGDAIDVSPDHQSISLLAPASDPALRARVFNLYMANQSYDMINKETGISKNTLKSWVNRERWKVQRDEANALNIADIMETKKVLLNDLSIAMLEGIVKTIQKAKGPDGAFQVKDLPTMLSAVGNIDKLSRLAMGLATSISEERSKRANFTLPLEHLKQVNSLKIADPFDDANNQSNKDPSGNS